MKEESSAASPLCVQSLSRAKRQGREEGTVSLNRLVLARGARDQPHYSAFCDRVIAAFPEATVEELPDVPHNRVPIPGASFEERRKNGKRTLVIGKTGTLLRQNDDPELGRGIKCARYWHFNTSWYCFYDCAWCYLNSNNGAFFSPAVRLFVNVDELVEQMSRRLAVANSPLLFYSGKLQDALQLDPISHHTRELIPFIGQQPNGRLLYLTKSTAVDNLLDLDHRGHTVLSWSLNPAEVARRVEHGAPPPSDRLGAARRCQDAGYEIRLVLMPVVPVEDWRTHYVALVEEALESVTPSRITLGGLCSYPRALHTMREVLGERDFVSPHLEPASRCRTRLRPEVRAEMYRFLLDRIHRQCPGLPVGLCLESAEVWKACRLDLGEARCNCVLESEDFSLG